MHFSLVHLNTFMILVATVTGIGELDLRSLTSNWEQATSEECGPIKIASRITGGKTAALGQYPWMARLGYQEDKKIEFKCGGSLINQIYVLSAAHCLFGFKTQLKVIRLGEHFANTTEDCEEGICSLPVQDIPVDKVIIHEHYDRDKVKNDISLIRLKSEVKYNEFVKPICLPLDEALDKSYVSQNVEIAGWGIIDSDTMQDSNTLLYVTLPVRDLSTCNESMPALEIDSNQFCVGLETGEDSCTGDSGGPMMRIEHIKETKKYYLLGVVSVGKSYCGEGPAVYTNVIMYNEWILKTITSTEQQYEVTTEAPEEKEN